MRGDRPIWRMEHHVDVGQRHFAERDKDEEVGLAGGVCRLPPRRCPVIVTAADSRDEERDHGKSPDHAPG